MKFQDRALARSQRFPAVLSETNRQVGRRTALQDNVILMPQAPVRGARKQDESIILVEFGASLAGLNTFF
jgi:hypothetical protein